MRNVEKHFQYLIEVVRGKGDNKQEERGKPSLHAIYVELNKLAGMYWIVCSAFLLERMQPGLPGLSQLKEKFNHQLNESIEKEVVLDELGGPLRVLSFVQLVELLRGENVEEKQAIYDKIVKLQIKNFFEKYINHSIEKNLPFWFDMRGVYCLCVMLKLTGMLTELNLEQREALLLYITKSQNILGGFGAKPGSEAHGGYTFCAVASLKILNAEVPNQHRLTVWLKQRLGEINGRVGKPRDSCYLWWVGATLINMSCDQIVRSEKETIENFIAVNCYCPETGGFSKFPSIPVDEKSVHGKQDPDLFHTFLGIATHALLSGCIDPVTVLPVPSP